MSDTTKIAAPAKSCVQLGYERGALCDDAADCARNGCAKTRQAFGCIQELQGSKKCLVSCGAGLCAATRAPKAAPAPDADGLQRWGNAYADEVGRKSGWHQREDGYWTPWHLAHALIEQQARELSELREPIHEASGLPKATCPCGWCQKERAAKDAEILRLQHEVSNRNRRALDGDEYKAAFDAQYDRAERAERDLSDTHPRIVALESQLSAARAAIAELLAVHDLKWELTKQLSYAWSIDKYQVADPLAAQIKKRLPAAIDAARAATGDGNG